MKNIVFFSIILVFVGCIQPTQETISKPQKSHLKEGSAITLKDGLYFSVPEEVRVWTPVEFYEIERERKGKSVSTNFIFRFPKTGELIEVRVFETKIINPNGKWYVYPYKVGGHWLIFKAEQR